MVDAICARFFRTGNDRLAATGLDLDAATGEDRGSGGQSESLDHYDERGEMRVFGADVASRGTECGAGKYNLSSALARNLMWTAASARICRSGPSMDSTHAREIRSEATGQLPIKVVRRCRRASTQPPTSPLSTFRAAPPTTPLAPVLGEDDGCVLFRRRKRHGGRRARGRSRAGGRRRLGRRARAHDGGGGRVPIRPMARRRAPPRARLPKHRDSSASGTTWSTSSRMAYPSRRTARRCPRASPRSSTSSSTAPSPPRTRRTTSRPATPPSKRSARASDAPPVAATTTTPHPPPPPKAWASPPSATSPTSTPLCEPPSTGSADSSPRGNSRGAPRKTRRGWPPRTRRGAPENPARFILLKASDAIAYDLQDAYAQCVDTPPADHPDAAATVTRLADGPPSRSLSGRSPQPVDGARCFVRGGNLRGICQRDVSFILLTVPGGMVGGDHRGVLAGERPRRVSRSRLLLRSARRGATSNWWISTRGAARRFLCCSSGAASRSETGGAPPETSDNEGASRTISSFGW